MPCLAPTVMSWRGAMSGCGRDRVGRCNHRDAGWAVSALLEMGLRGVPGGICLDSKWCTPVKVFGNMKLDEWWRCDRWASLLAAGLSCLQLYVYSGKEWCRTNTLQGSTERTYFGCLDPLFMYNTVAIKHITCIMKCHLQVRCFIGLAYRAVCT